MANAILAAILSFFIPGLGQVYAGDIKRGVYIFLVAAIFVIVISLFFQEAIYYIVDFLISIYAAYDAYDLIKG